MVVLTPMQHLLFMRTKIKRVVRVLGINIPNADKYRLAETMPITTMRHELSTILETSVNSDCDVTTVEQNLCPQDKYTDDELRLSLVQKIMGTISLPISEEERALIQALLT